MCLGRLVRRGFLVPVGLALAALSPAAALSQKTAGTLAASPVVTSTRTDERAGGGSRIGHLLLALPQAARQLASAAGHVSHASHASHVSGSGVGHVSHASHASHASHVSSSGTSGSTAGSSSSAGSGAAVSTTAFKATLTMGQVKPKPRGTKAEAAGHFHATLVGTTLKWTLTHTHLSGAARSAAVHGGRRATNGPTLARLCASCASFETGAVVLTQPEINDLLAGRAYVDIITARNPKGEVRGQIMRG
jgi:CHRD domain